MTRPATDAAPLTLDDADFDRFREFFYRETGILFGPTKRYFVDKRIAACIDLSGRGDFDRWFADIRRGKDPDGMQVLISRLTVNETYFMRESYQFDALVSTVLPAVQRARPGRAVRILCLPCSTGEEPYSVALTLLERWPALAYVDVEIVGADIDHNAVAAARTGAFGARSVQRIPPSTRQRYFEDIGGGSLRISADLRAAVDFRLTNVFDAAQMKSYRDFDVIFCRNMLIYFDTDSARQVVENLFGALRPGGYLFLGHSESMSRISSVFDPVRLAEGIVYQRPEVR